MYHIVDADSQIYTADINTLKEWAQSGRVLPHTGIMHAATGHQIRADQIPELQALFVARYQTAALSRPAPPRKSPLPRVLIAGAVFIAFSFAMIAFFGDSASDLSAPAAAVREARLHSKPLVPAKNRPPMPAPVEAYLIKLYDVSNALYDALVQFGRVTKGVTKADALLADTKWSNTFNSACDAIGKAAGQMEGIGSAPPECQNIDKKVKALAQTCRDMVAEYKEGVKNMRLISLEGGDEELRKAGTLAEDLTDEQTALTAQYSGVGKIAHRSEMKKMKKGLGESSSP